MNGRTGTESGEQPLSRYFARATEEGARAGTSSAVGRGTRAAWLALFLSLGACSSGASSRAEESGAGSPGAGSGVAAEDSSASGSSAADSAYGSDSSSPDAVVPSAGKGGAIDAADVPEVASPRTETGAVGPLDGGDQLAPKDAATHVGGFIHPGLLLLQADLDRIRAGVSAGTAPWSAAWAALKSTDAGTGYQPSVSATVSDGYALQNQGHAAWVLAVKWVATGDMAFATACMRVIDAWVNTVTSMQTTTLRTGVGAMQMANAAEIMAFGFNGAAGWPAPQVSKGRTWFKDVVWPRIGMANLQRSSNWGTSAMAGCMAAALFADDRAKFDYTVSAYKKGFTDAPDGCSGVTQYVCEPTGQATEAGRDQGHAQGGVAHLVEVAMMAWNQERPTSSLMPMRGWSPESSTWRNTT